MLPEPLSTATHEKRRASKPLPDGPFKPLLVALHSLQQAATPQMRIRTALVTAREDFQNFYFRAECKIPDKGYGPQGQSSAGIKGTDTLVFVFDILDAY